MRGITKFVGLTVLGCLGAVGIANADQLIYTFDTTAVGAFGAGPYGTVTLTDNGGNVDVSVSLRGDLNFVNTGGPHSVFSFNVDGAVVADITNILFNGSSNSYFTVVTPGANTPYGTFGFMIDCTNASCKNGSPGQTSDPLTFTVQNASVYDFGYNSLGAYFAADVICTASSTLQGCSGATGAIAAFGENPPHDVPEPGTLGLLGFGLAGLGFGLRRRRKI